MQTRPAAGYFLVARVFKPVRNASVESDSRLPTHPARVEKPVPRESSPSHDACLWARAGYLLSSGAGGAGGIGGGGGGKIGGGGRGGLVRRLWLPGAVPGTVLAGAGVGHGRGRRGSRRLWLREQFRGPWWPARFRGAVMAGGRLSLGRGFAPFVPAACPSAARAHRGGLGCRSGSGYALAVLTPGLGGRGGIAVYVGGTTSPS